MRGKRIMSTIFVEQIQEKEKANYVSEVSPNFIYNRFDLFNDRYELFKISFEEHTWYIETLTSGFCLEIGIWLMDIPKDTLNSFVNYLFETKSKIRVIKYRNGYSDLGESIQKNHFDIMLSDEEDDIENRLSSKSRYNLRREQRLLEEEIGHYIMSSFSTNDSRNSQIVLNRYFELKKKTHNIDYEMSAEEYINYYHVSDCYTLQVEDEIQAIILSCEQCPIVYIENMTYNTDLSKYSTGKILYNEYLKCLCKKGFKQLYLAGGNLDYKKRYSSREVTVYDGEIYRDSISTIIVQLYGQIERVKHKLLKLFK